MLGWGISLMGLLLLAVLLQKKPGNNGVPPTEDLATKRNPVVILPALDVPEPKVLPAIVRFQLPTENTALTEGKPESFYMFVDRSTKGVTKQVWEAGMYGFVRDPVMLKDGTVIFSRFHEGMDILPVRRDAKGEPLDTVHTMADGIVAHANASARGSNYGKYVVVQHATNSGPFYSLYAHLASVAVERGQKVLCGDLLGVLGYTGAGINLRRAHVHVELNMLLSRRFVEWHEKGNPGIPNIQGSFNGQNLVGVDVAGWLKLNNENSLAKLSDYVIAQGPRWKVLVPNRGRELEISARYPWLRAAGDAAASWEITLAASGTPLAVHPSPKAVSRPTVSWVQPFGGEHKWVSRGMLSGTGSSATLTSSGVNFVQLITGDF